NNRTPSLDGEPLPLERYEMSRSLAIHPDRSKFVFGAEWNLRAIDRSGELLWQQDVPGVVWAVNISGDGRLVVAAYGDGTIRWHDIEDGKELLAFLPLADQQRWVAWTPEGYYASSAVEGTGELLGWHVNRGWDQPADFFPISAIGGFYQPDALPLALQELDTARALGLTKINHDRNRVQDLVDSAAPPGAQLHVLTVGVSDYAYHEHLKLDFADDDATDIANALIRQEGSLYAKVNTQHLVNDEATRGGVYQALNTIRTSMQPDQEDVAVIHFSGHGADVDGNYYLLPHDVQANDNVEISISGIEVERFKHLLSKMGEQGKVLVLLDACHSGNVSEGARNTLPDADKIRDELAAAGNGVIVLTSSTGKEISVENPDWQNGAFTEAVLEALAGKADHDGDRWLTVAELQGYVIDRVRTLTNNRQNPRVSNPSGTQFQTRLFVLTD
ncbi:MAG: caspase family protein, partial [Geminicoccaceae bacterium]